MATSFPGIGNTMQPIQNRSDFIGPVYFGSSGNQTGLTTFWNSASYKYTAFQAGNATADVTYIFPTAGPAGNNYLLGSSTAGVLSWINAPGIYAPISNPTFTGHVLIPDGTIAAPGLAFSADTDTGLSRTGANTTVLSSGGGYAGGGPQLTLSPTGFDMSVDNCLFPLGINGIVNNDMILQISNGSAGTSAVSVVSASSGRSTSLLAAFGQNYSSTRCGQPGADLAAIEFGGTNLSGAVIVTQANAALYFGTNQSLAVSINTSQVVSFVNAIVLSSLTASTVPYLNSSKALTSSAVTPTQLGFLDATSSIQTQINTKAPTASPTFTGVAGFAAGSVSAPSWYLSDSATGPYRLASNQIAWALNGVKAVSMVSTGTADDTAYTPLTLHGGGATPNGHEFVVYSTTAITTAKQIASLDLNMNLIMVAGADGSGNDFNDLIIASFFNSTPTTVSSTTSRGSPAARTYSMGSNGVVKVALASGTYTVRTALIGLGTR